VAAATYGVILTEEGEVDQPATDARRRLLREVAASPPANIDNIAQVMLLVRDSGPRRKKA
jgi:hypothetical protein